MKEFFKSLFPMKWYFLFVAVLLVWLGYANLSGDRIFSSDEQEQWSARGPGSQYGVSSHK